MQRNHQQVRRLATATTDFLVSRAPPAPSAASSSLLSSSARPTERSHVYTDTQFPQRHHPSQVMVFESSRRMSSSLRTSGPTPRDRRHEMERLWSGGDFSPRVMDPDHETHLTTRGTDYAILFPGSASQYIGMGTTLNDYTAGRRVWEEVEEALYGNGGWEEWVKQFNIQDLPGEAGLLGKWINEGVEARKHWLHVRQIVKFGPQALLSTPPTAHPAILTTSLAFLRVAEDSFAPGLVDGARYLAGHSSGEWAAGVAAGVFDGSKESGLALGVKLAKLHGHLTQLALSLPSVKLEYEPGKAPLKGTTSSNPRSGMRAIIISGGCSHADVISTVNEVSGEIRRERIEKYGVHGNHADLVEGGVPFRVGGDVQVASINSATQIILTGTTEGIERASEMLMERGIAGSGAELNVAAPFHCRFLSPASRAMEHVLSSLPIIAPRRPILSGIDGSVLRTREDIITNLVCQMKDQVRWASVIGFLTREKLRVPLDLANLGMTGFKPGQTHLSDCGEKPVAECPRLIFLGPGKALSNLARRDLQRQNRLVGGDDDQFPQATRRELSPLTHARSNVGRIRKPEPIPGIAQGPEVEVMSIATEEDLKRIGRLWRGDWEQHLDTKPTTSDAQL